MPAKTTHPPLYTLLAAYAAAGIILLGLGLLARETLEITNLTLIELLWIWPNLLGAFAAPFVLHLLYYHLRKEVSLLVSLRHFFLACCLTLAGAVVVEGAQMVLGQAAWDQFDVVASLLSLLAAGSLFLATTRSRRLGRLLQTQNY
jgi:hypothetical protein